MQGTPCPQNATVRAGTQAHLWRQKLECEVDPGDEFLANGLGATGKLVLVTNSPQNLLDSVKQSGPMRFDSFMRTALYDPDSGYYERHLSQDPVGKSGDFITSVSVGPTFGRLLALWLSQSLKSWPGRTIPCLIEAGAHNGQLALDILQALNDLNGLDHIHRYLIVEPSANRRDIQYSRLHTFHDKVEWMKDIHDLGGQMEGIFLSNELYDAMPVRRLYWNRNLDTWSEWYVGIDQTGSGLDWHRSSAPVLDVPRVIADRLNLPSGVRQVIPDDFTIEVSPDAVEFHRKISESIGCGTLLTIDYGPLPGHWLIPSRPQGSLRGFRKHHHETNILNSPGSLDITADVCFDDLISVAQVHGWTHHSCKSQNHFLTHILQANSGMLTQGSPFWSQADGRRFLTLISPAFFGDKFKVLVQSRGIGSQP
jgi:SAM-dependent MidA family methyltransferase